MLPHELKFVLVEEVMTFSIDSIVMSHIEDHWVLLALPTWLILLFSTVKLYIAGSWALASAQSAGSFWHVAVQLFNNSAAWIGHRGLSFLWNLFIFSKKFGNFCSLCCRTLLVLTGNTFSHISTASVTWFRLPGRVFLFGPMQHVVVTLHDVWDWWLSLSGNEHLLL